MTDNLTLNMDAYLPLRDVVFNTLREAILKGELKPGERLMELQLASKLGVSRTPIREAIRMLEQEGLAVTMPRKGAEVAKMTLKDMEDVLEVREALDELAAKIACKKISDEQLANLKTIKDEFKRSMDSGDVKKIAEEDVKFHDAIYEATNNAKLVSMMNNIREQMYRYRVEYLKDPKNYPMLVKEHDAIYRALESRNMELVTTESSATNLSATYFMRNFYSNNRDAMKSSKRKEYSITELAYDDSTALHRAAKKLKNYKYSDNENTDNIRGTVMALVDTYNNSIDSASNSSSTSMKRYAKQLKKLASKYSDELEDIGITINNDGTLKANEELVKKADADTLNSLFGNDNDFTSSLYRVSRQMSSSSYDDYYTSLRAGSNINLTV